MSAQFFSLDNQFFLAAHFQIPRMVASKKMREWRSQLEYWLQTNPMMSLPQINQKFIDFVDIRSPLNLRDKGGIGKPLPWDVIVDRNTYAMSVKTWQKTANVRRHDDQELERQDSIDRFDH